MWKKINLVFDAFVIGVLFEYTLRVEVSAFPIAIGIILLLSICLDIFWLDKLKVTKEILVNEIEVRTNEITSKLSRTVPKGWMVYDAGQSPLHMKWYVQLVHFDDLLDDSIEDPRQVFVEEYDSYKQALRVAISEVNAGRMRKV